MILNRYLVSLCLALLTATTGCATPRSEPMNARVKLTEAGQIFVGETQTGLDGMVRRLKADGYTRQSRITVEIPHNTSPAVMQTISRQLASAGFRRFLFVKPQKAVAEVAAPPSTNRFREAGGAP